MAGDPNPTESKPKPDIPMLKNGIPLVNFPHDIIMLDQLILSLTSHYS